MTIFISFFKKVFFGFIICLFAICTIRAQKINKQKSNQPITLLSELKAFYNISELPSYRSNTYSAQVSTYDKTGGNNDGFNGTYSFVRKNADSTLVIFDVKGAGVINRIWTPTPTEDTLDFYIDDTTKPALTIKYKDLFSGKIFPFVAPLCGSQLGGNFCYFPLLFRQRCMIIARTKKMQFHQIQYRLFEKNTKVKSFSLSLSNEEKNALKKISELWDNENKSVNNFFEDSSLLKAAAVSFELKPGETKNIFSLQEGGRIAGIELLPAAAFEGLMKNVDIRVYWDDEKLPAIYCPVADFFGYAFGKRSMQSLMLGSKTDMDYCYIPMPFDKQAKIELLYREYPGAQALQLNAKIYYTAQKRNAEAEGKLYTCWQSEKPETGKPHVFLETEGKGHYFGTVLQAQGLASGMTYFFEGDDSTVIDGEMQLHGTGSEDYFNGGWYALLDCWDSRMSLPIHGALDYSLPFCRTGGYRFYLSDKLSFEKNIYQSIEHGPANNVAPAEYTSVSFYYSNTPAKNILQPADVSTNVYISDTLTIYPQLMDFAIDGAVNAKLSWLYPTGGTSCDFTISSESLIRVSLKDILPGNFKLFLDYEANPAGCDFSIWQRQSQKSEWINANSKEKKRIEQQYLCDIKVDDLINTFSIRFKATESNKTFLVNRFFLVKQK